MPTRTALFLLVAACSAPAKETSPPAQPRTEAPAPAAGPREPHDQPLGDPGACPAIQLKAPDSAPAGVPLRVSANLVGGPAAPTYKWTVSGGRITGGQGTTNLVVDTAGLAGTSITATLELGGVNTQCAATSARASVLIGPAS